MGKTNKKRATQIQENNVGCTWGLIRMFYSRRDPKLILDRKQGSRRHSFSGFPGRGRSRNKSRDFEEIDEDGDNMEGCSTTKPTVKKLMEGELGKLKQSKKIPNDEVQRILADLGHDVCLDKRATQSSKPKGITNRNADISIASSSGSPGHSGSKYLKQAEEDDLELALSETFKWGVYLRRFALHDDSSKKMSSFPANSASCVREESQLQLAKIPSSPNHRWNPSLPDSRCQVNEDVERKFQHVASSVHKMGMVLDSVQNDVMQLNRAMKEASLDSGSIQKKFVLVENSLQQILKGQDDLKELLLGSTKGNPDQMSVLNSHTSKLDELSSTLSVLNQVQEEMRQLKGDIFKIFTKEMEGVVRAIRSLSSKPDAIHTLADQSCTTNENLLMNQTPEADGRPQKKQTPVANVKPQKKQTPVAKGRPQKKQTAVPNEKPQRKQTTVAKGRPRKKQAPVPDGKPQMKQTPAANGRPQMKHAQIAHGISKMNQVAEANGKPPMKQIAAAEVIPAPQVYGRKVEALKAKVEEGKVVKAGAQNLAGSSCCMVAPKQEELGIQKVNPQALTTKVLIIDLDDDEEEGSDGSDTCVEPGLPVGLLTNGEEVSEDALEILRRARKRRRREATWDIVLVHE